jgi:Ca-activated chloride channel homolog
MLSCLMRSAVLALVAAVSAAGSLLLAQQPTLRDPNTFRTGIDITGITVTVRDADGHLVSDLPQEAFRVFDDGEPQQITQFTRERVPVSLGVLLDISDSMFGRRIEDARKAVDRFLFDLLDPADEFFLMAFNHKPRAMTGWTRVQTDVQRALDGLRPSGGTAIYDAIVESMPLIEVRTRARGALLVISDGADTASTAGIREVRAALLRSDVFIYAIAIDSPERQPINTRVNAQVLREITGESGGRTEIVRSSSDLVEATARIAEELNNQYVLGYTSPRGADNQYHSIRVRIRAPGGAEYRVRTRNGYIATAPRRP